MVEESISKTSKSCSISDIQINDQTEALALIFEMLRICQSRGSFTFEESSKIHEAMSMFVKKE